MLAVPMTRLWSLVVALAFSANTVVLPFADALLDHGRPAAAIPADHLEGPGGCGAHAEHCLLTAGMAAPVGPPAPRPKVPTSAPRRSTPVAADRHAIRPPLPAHPPSRGPPAPPA